MTLFVGGHCLITGMPGTAKTLLVRTLCAGAGPGVPAHPVHAGPDAVGHHRHRHHRRRAGHGPPHVDLRPGPDFRATCCSPTKSTARRPRRSRRCSKPCRNARARCAATSTRSSRRSSCSPRRTRSSSKARIRCPKRSSTASLFNVLLDYLTAEQEVKVVDRPPPRISPQGRSRDHGRRDSRVPEAGAQVPIAESVANYAVTWCAPRAPRPDRRRTRQEVRPLRRQRPRHAVPGAGRQGARADAAGRYHVTDEDIRALALPVLRHRVLTNYQAESDGMTTRTMSDEIWCDARSEEERRERAAQRKTRRRDGSTCNAA